MSSLHFTGQQLAFKNFPADQVKPGSIVKITKKADPFEEGSGGDVFYKVDAVDNVKLYGTKVVDIEADVQGPYSKNESFEVIA